MAAGTLAIVVLGAIPLIAQRDSYPHSDLPMFARGRDRISRFTTAVGVDDSGRIVRLNPSIIAATDEVIAAQAALVGAVNSGEADSMCREIASRIDGVALVRIQSETHDIIKSLNDIDSPITTRIHAECETQPSLSKDTAS